LPLLNSATEVEDSQERTRTQPLSSSLPSMQ
jgi:hypothetical protein